MKIKKKSNLQSIRGFSILSIALIFCTVVAVIAFGGISWVWPVIFGGALAFWIYDEFLD